MSKGKINVSVENIFPLIKKFLYSDQEIFLRELISNATDATLKLKHMSNIGEFKENFGEPIIEVKIDKKKSKLHIIDSGVGMTEKEVKKYINEVAFSGAEEFIEKYKDSAKDSGIIGHFGLGFYSAFMVSDSVEIISKSYKKSSPAIHWSCDGSPEFNLVKSDKKTRGTEIILNISKDSKSFLEEQTIGDLLKKYNRFMPIPIKFGTKEISKKEGEGKKEKEVKESVDNIINITDPAWTKNPKDLKEDDYKGFYKDLYPMNFEDPLFNIHLNVDYPFNLTGILYFPKLKNQLDLQKNKIQLYSNQVFITDSVENIVPELEFEWAVMQSYHKQFACCQYSHSAVEAALQILPKFNYKDIEKKKLEKEIEESLKAEKVSEGKERGDFGDPETKSEEKVNEK